MTFSQRWPRIEYGDRQKRRTLDQGRRLYRPSPSFARSIRCVTLPWALVKNSMGAAADSNRVSDCGINGMAFIHNWPSIREMVWDFPKNPAMVPGDPACT